MMAGLKFVITRSLHEETFYSPRRSRRVYNIILFTFVLFVSFVVESTVASQALSTRHGTARRPIPPTLLAGRKVHSVPAALRTNPRPRGESHRDREMRGAPALVR